MFWKKPPKSGKTPEKKLSREDLIAQAKANVAAAREELGEETIAKMRAILLAQEKQQKAQEPRADIPAPTPSPKETTPAQRARELIEKMDKAKVADYVRSLSREDE